jgi:spore coat protein U-like protein
MVNRISLAGAFALGLMAQCASAASSTSVAKIRMSVPLTCEIRAADQVALDFGQKASLSANIDATGTIKVLCSTYVQWSVFASNGDNYLVDRRMKNSSSNSYIRYGLFANSGRTDAFPTAAGSYGRIATGLLEEFPMYGRIFGGQTADPGDYADTLVVTVTW